MACKGCIERREKIIATTNKIIDWIKNPTGPAPFDQLIGRGNPTQVRPPLTPRPPIVKPK